MDLASYSKKQDRKEIAKHSGKYCWAQVRRPGGKFNDIDCITLYKATKKGSLLYVREVMSTVANKQQRETANRDFPKRVFGRPTAKKIMEDVRKGKYSLDEIFSDT